MRRKGGNLFEEHVEKIVLALVGLVCVWLLITRVIISPNKVLLYAGVKLGPGEIDRRISREAEVLKSKLDSAPEPLPPYQSRVDAFVDMINTPIDDIDTSLHLPLPIYSSADVIEKRKYNIPWIGEIEETAIDYIRAVAYVPMVQIDEENPYEMMICQPNDIDFVTVEGKFDIAGLYGRFYDSFAGDNVEQEQWRDPCLALPIFASVQLQRQELGDDGSWSQWQIVPRTKIDPRKNMFESVEEVEDLPPGGIKVRLLQFDDPQVRKDLLQPEAYKIASTKEEWFPPLIHKKFVEQQKEMEKELKLREKEVETLEREQKEEKVREEREKAREDRRGRGTDTRSSPGSRGRYDDTTRRDDRLGGRRGRDRMTRTDGTDDAYGYESDAISARRREREERAREREERLAEMKTQTQRTSIDDIYKELGQILITKKTDFSRLREPLTFWAHDDTIEGGKSYRYRIRLGVFNPIAGTNSFKEEDGGLKNKIVLWSEFSDVERIVKVPEKLYFFPRDVKDTARIVTVDVARYKLGYWYIKDFVVKPGEDIGKVVDFEPEVEENRRTIMPMAPQTIDYSTGAVLVDLVSVNDWSGGRNMYPRQYYDMLYSFDGINIERIPVSTRYWGEELRIKLNEIKQLQKEPREPLRMWDSKLSDWELGPEMELGYERPMEPGDERRRTPRRPR